MDEKIEKILGLIQTLPADQVVIIADKCKTMSEISPRVQKIVDLVWKLNEKEQAQFFSIINGTKNGMEQFDDSSESVWSDS